MSMFNALLLVGLGGAIGSALRFLLSSWAGQVNGFFVVTLAVNLAGSFLIGLIFGAAEQREFLTTGTRLFLLTGILGGFTTFSAFSLVNFSLFQDGRVVIGFMNILLQIVLGLGLCAAGYFAGGHWLKG